MNTAQLTQTHVCARCAPCNVSKAAHLSITLSECTAARALTSVAARRAVCARTQLAALPKTPHPLCVLPRLHCVCVQCVCVLMAALHWHDMCARLYTFISSDQSIYGVGQQRACTPPARVCGPFIWTCARRTHAHACSVQSDLYSTEFTFACLSVFDLHFISVC